jgi:molybdenum cofactor cytidylyltransferase
MSVGIILLAAGASTRMGQSKQLLNVGGVPLLIHATAQAMASSNNVMVVLGANATQHESILKPLSPHVAINTSWQKGLGSSIKTGVRGLLSISPHLDGIMIMVCDQPRVTSDYLNILIKTFLDAHGSIVASQYGGTQGVPAIFSNIHFHDLLGLEDECGAKAVIMRYANEVVSIDFPEGKNDLDTPEDYDKFLNTQK